MYLRANNSNFFLDQWSVVVIVFWAQCFLPFQLRSLGFDLLYTSLAVPICRSTGCMSIWKIATLCRSNNIYFLSIPRYQTLLVRFYREHKPGPAVSLSVLDHYCMHSKWCCTSVHANVVNIRVRWIDVARKIQHLRRVISAMFIQP